MLAPTLADLVPALVARNVRTPLGSCTSSDWLGDIATHVFTPARIDAWLAAAGKP
jgi:hypothetical protein